MSVMAMLRQLTVPLCRTFLAAAAQLLGSQRFNWIDSSNVAGPRIACKRSCGSQYDRHCNERQGTARVDAEQQCFHESHQCGGRRLHRKSPLLAQEPHEKWGTRCFVVSASALGKRLQ